jgi:polyketide synthase 12/myxalamid-type polyketide synthase MxaB
MAALHREGGSRYFKKGVRAIGPAYGVDLFDRILAGDPAQVYAADIDWMAYAAHAGARRGSGFLGHLLNGTAVEDGKADNRSAFQQKLAGATEESRIAILRSEVLEAARKVMDHENAARIRTDQPLMEQGLDSLMSVELRNLLSRNLDIPLPVGLLFNYPSIEDLCPYLAGLLISDPEAASVDRLGTPVGKREDEFAYIDEIDPDELEKMIQQEIG